MSSAPSTGEQIEELKKDLDAARAKVALLTSAEGLSAFTSLVDEVRRFLAAVEAKDLNSSSLASADSSGSVGSTTSTDSASSLSWSELSNACGAIQQRVDAINALGLLESSPGSRRKKVKGSRVRRRSGRLGDDELKTALSGGGGSSGSGVATSGLAVGTSADGDDDEQSESQSQSQSQFDSLPSSNTSAGGGNTGTASGGVGAAAEDSSQPKLRSWKLRSTETGLALRKSAHAGVASPTAAASSAAASSSSVNDVASPNLSRRSSADRYLEV